MILPRYVVNLGGEPPSSARGEAAASRRPQRRGGAGSASRWWGGPAAATAGRWSRRLAVGAAAGSVGGAWGCPAVVGRCGAGRLVRRRHAVGSGGSSGVRSRGHSRAGWRSGRLRRPAGRAGSSAGGRRCDGGRAAGRRGSRRGRRGGVHAGGTHTSGGLVGSLWLQTPMTREATSSALACTQRHGQNLWPPASALPCPDRVPGRRPGMPPSGLLGMAASRSRAAGRTPCHRHA